MNSTNIIVGDFQRFLRHEVFKLGDTQFTVGTFVWMIFWIVVILVGNVLVRRFLVRRLLKRTHIPVSLQYAIDKISGYVFIVVGVFVVLQINNVNLSSLAVVASAVGVGVGFGLQNIVNNFVSGLIILAERPISIGDRVEAGGHAGIVRQINLRSTTIVTNDNISIIVPNSEFISSSVINWSYGDTRVRIRLPVGVGYGTNPETLRELMIEVAKGQPMVLKEPVPELYFSGFGESSLDFELAVWTAEMTPKPRRFKSDLYYAIHKKLVENGIEIPFPQRDVRLRGSEEPPAVLNKTNPAVAKKDPVQ